LELLLRKQQVQHHLLLLLITLLSLEGHQGHRGALEEGARAREACVAQLQQQAEEEV
jgi:hypothetical protein